MYCLYVLMFYFQLNNCSVMSEHFVFRGLPSDSTSVLKAEPGNLYNKRRQPGIPFISLAVVSIFKLAIMTLFVDVRVESESLAM